MKKLNKEEVKKEIEKSFSKKLFPEEIKKIKRLAMKYNIKLKGLRKKFCKRCYSLLDNANVRIKSGKKIVKCKNCGFISRWKLQT